MKSETRAKWRQIGLFFGAVILCAAVFVLAAVGILWQEGIADNAQKNQSGEVYTPPPPKNTALMFLWEEGGGEIFYLDFEENRIVVTILPQKCDENAALVYGYREFEAVKANYLLISSLIDRLGGVETVINGENLRLTGVQVMDYLSPKSDNFEPKRQIISALFKKIEKLTFCFEKKMSFYKSV